MLVGKIHDDLSREHYLTLAQTSFKLLLGDVIVGANDTDNVINGECLIVDLHGSHHYSLNELHVNITVVGDTVSHERVDDALNLSHAAVCVLGYVGDYVFRNVKSVTLNLSFQDIHAELHVWLLHLCHYTARETCDETIHHAAELNRWTVANENDTCGRGG